MFFLYFCKFYLYHILCFALYLTLHIFFIHNQLVEKSIDDIQHMNIIMQNFLYDCEVIPPNHIPQQTIDGQILTEKNRDYPIQTEVLKLDRSLDILNKHH